MKKKTGILYFLIPIVALVAFVPVFLKFNASYEAGEAARAAATRQAKIATIAEQDRLRQKAIEDSLVTQKRRAADKATREAKRQKENDDREAAIQARNKAASEVNRLKDRAERLAKDVSSTKEEITKLEQDEGKQKQDQAAAQQYVVLAEANVKNLSQVLDRIAAADAAAEAARAAAAAKKS